MKETLKHYHKTLIQSWKKWIIKILHIPTSAILLTIAGFFIYLTFKLFFFTVLEFFNGEMISSHEILENIFLIFLYIEIIASIKIYFEENFHFPLKFFFYIGMTDIIRSMIIFKEDPKLVLSYTLALLILVIALSILEVKNFYLFKKRGKEDENNFEL